MTRNLQYELFKSISITFLIGLLLSACQSQPLEQDIQEVAPTSIAPIQTAPTQSPSARPVVSISAPALPTSSPTSTATVIPTLPIDNPSKVKPPEPTVTNSPQQSPLVYYAQAGDTLAVVAKRFHVHPSLITSPQSLLSSGLLVPGQMLLLPSYLKQIEFTPLLPDSEIVYGPSTTDFDVDTYLNRSHGYLSQHKEYLHSTGWTSAADIVSRVAVENSINPRLLIALLEYSSGCISGGDVSLLEDGYVLGVENYLRKGLYGQLWWAANQLSTGYYGWRSGSLLEIELPDGKIYRPAPDSNAGSVAIQYYFAQLWAAYQNTDQGDSFDYDNWLLATDPLRGFPLLHQQMFGDAWERAAEVEPLFPAGLKQPDLTLPFEPGMVWSYAAGPHPAWQSEGALAALDFAPSTNESGCVKSAQWVVAVGNGPVVRSENGAVVQDLDYDGSQPVVSDMDERTGWAILYMHIASEGRVKVGTYLQAGDRIGHPSCEGGPATGTHLHIARKYNGEWIAADGPLPFVMDGWRAHAGELPYKGTLTKGDQVVIANTSGTKSSQLSRPEADP